MRVKCKHCSSKSIIYANKVQTNEISDLYCRCTNQDCLSSFVMTLHHKHDIQPPIQHTKTVAQALIAAIDHLPDNERAEIIKQLNAV